MCFNKKQLHLHFPRSPWKRAGAFVPHAAVRHAVPTAGCHLRHSSSFHPTLPQPGSVDRAGSDLSLSLIITLHPVLFCVFIHWNTFSQIWIAITTRGKYIPILFPLEGRDKSPGTYHHLCLENALWQAPLLFKKFYLNVV